MECNCGHDYFDHDSADDGGGRCHRVKCKCMNFVELGKPTPPNAVERKIADVFRKHK